MTLNPWGPFQPALRDGDPRSGQHTIDHTEIRVRRGKNSLFLIAFHSSHTLPLRRCKISLHVQGLIHSDYHTVRNFACQAGCSQINSSSCLAFRLTQMSWDPLVSLHEKVSQGASSSILATPVQQRALSVTCCCQGWSFHIFMLRPASLKSQLQHQSEAP